MIRVNRGQEPAKLGPIRNAELARLRPIAAQQRPTQKDIGKKYAAPTSKPLWRAQHQKCCYCECKEQNKRNDVEHFRPKGRAIRAPGVADEHGYWWLAWTWENLVFSCRNCNQSPAKLDKFPLDIGSVALVAEEAAPGRERPLLIDPALESAMPHIQFVRYTVNGEHRWKPVPRNGSVRGEQTIRVCLLDRDDLLDLYAEHVRLNLQEHVDVVLAAAATNDTPGTQVAWYAAVRRWVRPEQVFAHLSHDVLAALVPSPTRGRFGLGLPTPDGAVIP